MNITAEANDTNDIEGLNNTLALAAGELWPKMRLARSSLSRVLKC